MHNNYLVVETDKNITFTLTGDEVFLTSRRVNRIFKNYGFTFDYRLLGIYLRGKVIGTVAKHDTSLGVPAVVVTVEKVFLNAVLCELNLTQEDLELDSI